MNFYEANVSVLQQCHPSLYELLNAYSVTMGNYEIIKGKTGHYTVHVSVKEHDTTRKFYIHSKYNPVGEAESFAESRFKTNKRINILYGFGFGYHVAEALKYLQLKDILYVFDLNIDLFKLALEHCDLQGILCDKRLHLVISDDEAYVAKQLQEVLSDDTNFVLYVPSIKAIPPQHEYFKFLLEDWNMKKSLTAKWVGMLQENYETNKKLSSKNVSCFFGEYPNKPFVIVSAGPSLNKNKALLKEIEGKAFIFAVGSALKPLLKAGIKPDMFCIIDPQDITYKQIEGYEEMDIPFVYLDTSSSYTVSKYEGPKYVACNEPAHTKEPSSLIESGGSVATAVLDMAIKFGGNPIAFVGQDLAFTNDEHHADGSMYGEEVKVNSLPNMRKVKGQNGEILNTTLGLLSFKYWIENKIKDNSEVTFINATEGGAFIEGCTHLTLESFIYRYII